MDNYAKLMAHEGVENCHPKFIAVVDGKKDVVAEVVDGTVYLTEAGKKLLGDAPAHVEAKAPKKVKKPAAVVESANTLVDNLGDLNLSE